MDSFKAEMNSIRQNRKDGSLQILNDTIAVIMKYLASPGFSETELVNQVTDLSKTFFDFAVLQHFISGINQEGNTKKDFLDYLSNYKLKWHDVDRSISNHFLSRIEVNDSTILLHSNSRTIRTLFEEIARRNLSVNVFQTESLPGGEGVLQAEFIRKPGITVLGIKDDDVIDHLSNLDMFLIGADRIEQENVINKVGSLAITKAFYKAGKPVYVLADSRKISEDEIPVKSGLFEKVPLRLVTDIITERGLLFLYFGALHLVSKCS